jgi:hydroxyacyl-ACP dehydratase HTD2-like protein with hotdog domain
MIDPALEGQELETVSFVLDRSKLAELARAFHEDDPAWSDPRAARAQGFETIPAPPTATVLADHWRPGGALAHAEAAGIDVARLLHGEASWEYLRPLRVGDELTAVTVVSDLKTREGKRGGTMTFLTVETRFTDPDGALAAIRRDTLIETGAAS